MKVSVAILAGLASFGLAGTAYAGPATTVAQLGTGESAIMIVADNDTQGSDLSDNQDRNDQGANTTPSSSDQDVNTTTSSSDPQADDSEGAKSGNSDQGSSND